MGVRGEIFSNRVILPNRTYFFNVKENRMGDLYLNIVESKNRDSGGFDRQSVVLFADDLQEFLKGFDESLKALEKAAREKRHSGGDKNRKPRIKPDEYPVKAKEDFSGRDEKFRREDRGEKKSYKTERGERGRPSAGRYSESRSSASRPPRGRPPIERKNTKERWGEDRQNPGGGRNNRSRSGGRAESGERSESGGRRSSYGQDSGKKGNKRIIVRKRDRDN